MTGEQQSASPFGRKIVFTWFEFIWRYLLTIALAIAVPILLSNTTKNPRAGASVPQFSSGERLAIGLLIGVVGLLLTASIDLRRLTNERATEDRELDRVIAHSADLKRISDGLNQISRRDPSRLLATLFEISSHELGNRITKSADTLELELSPRLGDTRVMLGCMRGDVCRFVHYFDNTFFATHNRHSIQFWEDLHEKIKTRDIRKVERLFIMKQDDAAALAQLRDEPNRRLIGMHLTERNYECAIIDEESYDELQLQHFPAGTRLDVGIYGDRFVYISEQIPAAEPHTAADDVVGRLVADPERIAQCQHFFADCWRQALAPDRVASKYGLQAFPKLNLWTFFNPHNPEPSTGRRIRRRGVAARADLSVTYVETTEASSEGESPDAGFPPADLISAVTEAVAETVAEALESVEPSSAAQGNYEVTGAEISKEPKVGDDKPSVD